MSTVTGKVTQVEHPLVQHKLSYLRDRETPTVHFRKLVNEVTLLLTYEATKDFPGITGKITFAPGSHVPQKGVTVIDVENGALTLGGEVVPEKVPAP